MRALILSLTLAATLGATAQTPDFSGHWIAEAPAPPPASTPPAPARGDMGSGWGTPITIVHDATKLKVQHPLFSRYDLQPPLLFEYALDGSESKNAVMMGHATQVRVSRAQWDGATLRITTLYPGIDPRSGKPFTTEVIQQLSLTSPATLVIDVTRGAALGSQPTTTRTVYKKG
jgi:hypothetical protein